MDHVTHAAAAADNPRTVSRGFNPEIGFIGIDSLYLVVEYPHADVFERWSEPIDDLSNPTLHEGIVYEDMVLRRGGLGYKLSVWDGDARLFMTDRVNAALEGTASEGHGMGVMLQLGPLWLRQFGEFQGTFAPNILRRNVEGQLLLFGVENPFDYPVRINRMDITVDLVGLDIQTLSLNEWRESWVGYARPKGMYFQSKTGAIEGFSVGTSQGSVRFKVYDKVAEATKRGTLGFWRSVWGLPAEDDVGEAEDIPVARFEWTVKCYHARFVHLRYLQELTFERLVALLNYATLKWGRLCVPGGDAEHKAEWPLAPVWATLVRLIDDWSLHYDAVAEREYVFEPDIKEEYLKSLSGWLAGLLVRQGFNTGQAGPVSIAQGLSFLHYQGYTMADIEQRAREKWQVFARLARRSQP